MAHQVLRKISQSVKSAVTYSIMADENSDVSDSFNPNEDFIRMHPLLTTEADQIIAVIKDALLRCQDSSMVRFLRIDHMVSGSSPTSAKLSLRVRRVTSSL